MAPESAGAPPFRGVGVVKEASLRPLKSASSSRRRLDVNLRVREASPGVLENLSSSGDETRRAEGLDVGSLGLEDLLASRTFFCRIVR